MLKDSYFQKFITEVVSERCHIADRSYEIFNNLFQIGPRSRGLKWAMILNDIEFFQKLCFNL